MARLIYITHPEVVVEPDVPVGRWRLSDAGRRRMRTFAESGKMDSVTAVWASDEAKAVEAAEILARRLGLGVRTDPDLCENDRTATGFLPYDEFEQAADEFFAAPQESVRGWERAVDAQARVRAAVGRIVAAHASGDLAFVAHGAVGTLLYCALKFIPITRAEDQPSQGHYWTAELPRLHPLHRWRPIAPPSP